MGAGAGHQHHLYLGPATQVNQQQQRLNYMFSNNQVNAALNDRDDLDESEG